MYPPYLSGRSSPTYVKPYVDPYTSHAYFHRLLRQKILLQDERKGYVQGEFTERSMLPVQQSPGIDNICQRTQLAPLTVSVVSLVRRKLKTAAFSSVFLATRFLNCVVYIGDFDI